MLDMSWGEILVIGAVALIVIGPKDLPKALRTVGQMTTKIRRMAGEFQSQFNEAMREAELDEVRKQVSDINQSVSSLNTGFNPIQTVRDEMKSAIEGFGAAAGPSRRRRDRRDRGGPGARRRGEPRAGRAVDGAAERRPRRRWSIRRIP